MPGRPHRPHTKAQNSSHTLDCGGGQSLVSGERCIASLWQIMESVIAPSCLSVLIHGETGTGKEGIARAIHYHSRLRDKPFVAVNCAAIPENLAESLLFGHRRGAFTGASHDQVGIFEQASGGTLFLDEIGDLSASNQARLLRVLQEGEIVPLGATKAIHVGVRVLSASHKDLETLVAHGQFREDLFHRLDGLRVHMPPLRERPADIPVLANEFARACALAEEISCDGIAADALDLICAYSWPGNVRELKKTIAVAVAFLRSSPTRLITADLLRSAAPRNWMTAVSAKTEIDSATYLLEIIRTQGQCSTRTLAEESGLPQPTLWRRLQALEHDGLVIAQRRGGRAGTTFSLAK